MGRQTPVEAQRSEAYKCAESTSSAGSPPRALMSLIAIGPVPKVAAVASTPGTWAATGSLPQATGFAPAVLLNDGTVITAGGTDGVSFTAAAERFSGGTWASAGSIGQAVAGQVAALLPDGDALFAGGADAMSYYTHGDVFDPGAGTWTQTPAMVHAHAYGAAASLANGDVMVIGGYDGGDTFTTGAVDIYSAASGTWSAGPALPGGRYAFTATTLSDGRVLVAGGDDGSLTSTSALSSVEIYTPGSGGSAGSWSAAESMHKVRLDQAAVLLKDGRVLVAGGVDASGTALSSAEVSIPRPATGHSLADDDCSGRVHDDRASRRASRGCGWLWDQPQPGSQQRRPVRPTTRLDGHGGARHRAPVPGGHAAGRRHRARHRRSRRLVRLPRLMRDLHAATRASHLPGHDLPPTGSHANPRHPRSRRERPERHVSNGAPRRFQVAGRGGVPAMTDPNPPVAVTGILTTTASTAAGYLTIGPVFTAAPTFSTLNFPKGDNRANNVAVALDADGMLSVVYIGTGKTHALVRRDRLLHRRRHGRDLLPARSGARARQPRRHGIERQGQVSE